MWPFKDKPKVVRTPIKLEKQRPHDGARVDCSVIQDNGSNVIMTCTKHKQSSLSNDNMEE